MSIFVNTNGTWTEVTKPQVNVNGTWKNITGAWYNVNGVWKRFFPDHTVANLILIGGGGAGGSSNQDEGGGGGGGGGVTTVNSITISALYPFDPSVTGILDACAQITVGSGGICSPSGAISVAGGSPTTFKNAGPNFETYTAFGGGAGGTYTDAGGTHYAGQGDGVNYATGGGGTGPGQDYAGGAGMAPASTDVYNYSGGGAGGTGQHENSGGGGGGAGGGAVSTDEGQLGSSVYRLTAFTSGGPGVTVTAPLSGTVFHAGGGGAGGQSKYYAAGSVTGNFGGGTPNRNGTNGLGGGGGGGTGYTGGYSAGGNGGCGFAYIEYPAPQIFNIVDSSGNGTGLTTILNGIVTNTITSPGTYFLVPIGG